MEQKVVTQERLKQEINAQQMLQIVELKINKSYLKDNSIYISIYQNALALFKKQQDYQLVTDICVGLCKRIEQTEEETIPENLNEIEKCANEILEKLNNLNNTVMEYSDCIMDLTNAIKDKVVSK